MARCDFKKSKSYERISKKETNKRIKKLIEIYPIRSKKDDLLLLKRSTHWNKIHLC